MDESRDVYHFGECKICKALTALKNGYCPKCRGYDTVRYPDFLKDIFGNFSKDK